MNSFDRGALNLQAERHGPPVRADFATDSRVLTDVLFKDGTCKSYLLTRRGEVRGEQNKTKE